jgi:hypothetical protein
VWGTGAGRAGLGTWGARARGGGAGQWVRGRLVASLVRSVLVLRPVIYSI